MVDLWKQELLRSGTIKVASVSLRVTWARKLMQPMLDEQISAVTPRRAAAMYEQLQLTESKTTRKPLAAATQRLALWASRNFFAWASTVGCVGSNSFKDVKPVGKVSAGKPQLRIEEARRFTQTVLELFETSGHALPIGALVALVMGLRTQEVLLREVRDLDDGGRLLWIDEGKTANAKRHLEDPELLRPYLLRLAAGRPSVELHILDASHAKGEAQAEVIAEAVRAQLERPILLRLAELPGQSEPSSDRQIRLPQSIRSRSVGPNQSTDSVERGDGEYLAG